MQVTTSERGSLLSVQGGVLAILTPRLLRLAQQSELAAGLYNEDGSVNAGIAFNAIESFWYDGFIQRYKEGDEFDRMEEELEQELIEAEVERDKATEWKGDIKGALSLLEGVLEGRVSSPSTTSLRESRPATLSEMKEKIIRGLGAYYLRYQLWEDADVLKEGERLLARARQRERKAEQRRHVITWRKSTLERARKNCLRYGDLRRWHERYNVSAPKTIEEAPARSTPGRPRIINDPSAYPVEMLKALLEWTADERNKAKSFRGKDSLCGFIAQRLKPHMGYEESKDTIRSRLESLMDSLNVDLPHGPSNKLSYFEARDEIKRAMEIQGLLG